MCPSTPRHVGGGVRPRSYRLVLGNKLLKNGERTDLKLNFKTENVIKCTGVKLKMQMFCNILTKFNFWFNFHE